jgi:SAM-dependent methyltransferase
MQAGLRAHFEGAVWDEPLTEWERTRIAHIPREIPPDVRTIADVGCGDGRLTHVLADLGYDVVGMDGSPRALEKVRVPKRLCDVDRLDAPDASFDLVVCTEVLEHLPDPVFARAVAELRRIARRWVIVTVPHAEDLREASVRCPQCGQVFHAYGHVRRFTVEDVRRLMPGNDLVEVNTRPVPAWHPRLLDLRTDVLRRYAWMPNCVCHHCGNTDFSRARHDPVRRLLGAANKVVMRGRTRPRGYVLGRFKLD